MTGLFNDTTVAATLSLPGADDLEIGRVETPNGVRLQLRTNESRIRLDALALESLTWQPAAFFEALSAEGTPEAVTDRAVEAGREYEGAFDRHVDPTDGASADLEIGNEFTTVAIRVGDDRLELRSPKAGYGTWLDPDELRGLARLDMGLFSELLRTPLGPEDEH